MVIDRESSRILPATRRLWTHQLAMAGKRRKSSATNQWLSGYLCDEMTSNLDDSIGDDFSVASCQWEFQDPKMDVPYHIKPYFGCISPYIGLINGRYLQFRYLKLPLNSLSQSNRPLLENPPFISIYMCIHIYIYVHRWFSSQPGFITSESMESSQPSHVSSFTRSEAVDPKREGVLREASLHMTGKSEKLIWYIWYI